MSGKNLPFRYTMTKNEKILGWAYLPVHIFLLPLIFNIYVYQGGSGNEVQVNAAYYGIGLIYVLLFMRRYLRAEFDTLLDNKLLSAVSVVTSYFIYTVLAYGALFLLSILLGDIENPNNEAVENLVTGGRNAMFGVVVIMAPVLEEVLFRGVVFSSLRKKSRVLAYAVSAALFSLYHIWSYTVAYGDITMLLYGIQYIPPAVALAWCYERSGSIWPCIIFHMCVNGAGLIYM